MSVAQLPGSMYPTATRNPGPEKAKSFRQKPAPGGTNTLRCTSGKEGVAIARLSGMAGAGSMVWQFSHSLLSKKHREACLLKVMIGCESLGDITLFHY